MAKLRLRYIHEYNDRQGRLRRYFRKGSVRGPLPGDVGSPEFMTAYQAYCGTEPKPTSTKLDGSLGLLITEFYASRAFRNLKPSSKQTYRAALEPIAQAHGHRTARLTHKNAAKLIADIGEKKPAMANLTKRVLQAVYKYAVNHVIQQKTGAELYLPFVEEMQQALVAIPARGLTLFTREDGRPMTRAGLTSFMRHAIDAAGLPAKCVPHGLRKAGMRRMAEAGKTEKQIAAVSGHKSLREVQRYTEAADQRRLARDAMGNKKR